MKANMALLTSNFNTIFKIFQGDKVTPILPFISQNFPRRQINTRPPLLPPTVILRSIDLRGFAAGKNRLILIPAYRGFPIQKDLIYRHKHHPESVFTFTRHITRQTRKAGIPDRLR